MEILYNCKFFKGYAPCIKNKDYDVQCDNCNYYIPITERILIIKFAAIGDVIRTTPIITRLREIYQNPYIYWLTEYPEVLSDNHIDQIMNVDFESIEILKNLKFDMVINLDKSILACALTSGLKSKYKRGFNLHDNVIYPVNEATNHKYLTGLFDSISKHNRQHYIEEIFNICEIGEFNNEPYILENKEIGQHNWQIDKNKTVIGLNTGCSNRWSSRLWKEKNWTALADILLREGYEVVLLGGKLEADKNRRIAFNSGASYFGYHDLPKFIDLVDQCDLIVSQVTSAVHIALGLKKKVVVMNNIFNSNEFYLYDLGVIVEPKQKCDCYYLPQCKHKVSCMDTITVNDILSNIKGTL